MEIINVCQTDLITAMDSQYKLGRFFGESSALLKIMEDLRLIGNTNLYLKYLEMYESLKLENENKMLTEKYQ